LARFRRGAKSAFALCRFSACIMPIRAIISDPSRSATSSSVSIAVCQHSLT
jgi:hypothetical protein